MGNQEFVAPDSFMDSLACRQRSEYSPVGYVVRHKARWSLQASMHTLVHLDPDTSTSFDLRVSFNNELGVCVNSWPGCYTRIPPFSVADACTRPLDKSTVTNESLP
jgi:hypothetical protein